MRVRAAALAGSTAVALLLAGCGGAKDSAPASTTPTAVGSTGSGSASSADPSASAGVSDSSASDPSAVPSSSESAAPTPGPEVPPATAVAAAVAKDLMPTVTSKAKDKPALSFPKTAAPNTLQRQILTQGTGKAVKAGDFLSVNYLGIVWGATKAFDNSYDRKAPTTFQIGKGKVVAGWDTTLVGMKLGSRVLISLPPADGYGAAGNQGAGIKGTDTIVFVVDIVDSISADQGGQTDAKLQTPLPTGIPAVTGALGTRPTLTIPKGLAEPTTTRVVKLAVGSGAALTASDQILAQYELTTWDGSTKQGTWPVANPTTSDDAARAGLQKIPLTSGSPFEKLVGLTVGSRVLLLVPASAGSSGSSGATPALAAVVDIVGKG